jgi:ABC-type antimicrobial peptide transport system permease subunit
MIFNADPDLTFTCVSFETNLDCPFNYVVSDDTYERFRKSVLTVNYEKLDLVCDTEEEVKALNEFIDRVSDYYASGELKATPENGYTAPVTFPDVKLLLSVKSTHNEILQPHIDESKEAVSSRLLIMAAIIVVSVVIVFFTMKSYSIKNIYDIGVYRALGIKKSSIAFVYAIEIFIISCKTTLIGGILCYLVTNIIASIPIIDVQIAITFPMFILTTLGMILLNVLVGVLPVRLCMRQTPSKILSKYDI